MIPFIKHTVVEAVLAVWIDDVPTGCLKDGVLDGLAGAVVAWPNGGNVYLHCHEGVSRASYIDIAIGHRCRRRACPHQSTAANRRP